MWRHVCAYPTCTPGRESGSCQINSALIFLVSMISRIQAYLIWIVIENWKKLPMSSLFSCKSILGFSCLMRVIDVLRSPWPAFGAQKKKLPDNTAYSMVTLFLSSPAYVSHHLQRLDLLSGRFRKVLLYNKFHSDIIGRSFSKTVHYKKRVHYKKELWPAKKSG